MAGRTKGSVKTGGRKPNTPNKKTAEAIKRVEWVLSLLEPTLDKDIQSLKPNERVSLWNDLQEFVRPKLSRTEVKNEGSSELVIRVIEE